MTDKINYTFSNCDQWLECLKTHDIVNKDDMCCTILCLPIKFPLNLIFCGPCVLFNISCNKCKNTKDNNYLF
jgi:hypothetical protein